VQAGPPALESRRAVSGGATATRAASAGGDALPRRAPCPPDTHQRKCSRGSHGCPPVLCSLHANACAHGPDGKAFTYPSIHTGALLPRHSNTDAHDCVHTSPCNMAPTHMACRHSLALRHANASGTPAAPTLFVAATLAPCCSSVCTTAACPDSEAKCKLVLPYWRAGVRSAAGTQRQERPRQAATLSRAGHPALRTRTSASTLQQGVAWAPSRAMHPPRQCMRTRP
jgi:hypothetical protein